MLKNYSKKNGLQLNLNKEMPEDVNESDIIIADQTPKPGIIINKDSNIYDTVK